LSLHFGNEAFEVTHLSLEGLPDLIVASRLGPAVLHQFLELTNRRANFFAFQDLWLLQLIVAQGRVLFGPCTLVMLNGSPRGCRLNLDLALPRLLEGEDVLVLE